MGENIPIVFIIAEQNQSDGNQILSRRRRRGVPGGGGSTELPLSRGLMMRGAGGGGGCGWDGSPVESSASAIKTVGLLVMLFVLFMMCKTNSK